jgi:hypothetical protein
MRMTPLAFADESRPSTLMPGIAAQVGHNY